jgi:hypothetical protein
MSKFSLKAEHFVTPIKLILPGIIVSLVGASAVFFIFNNPDKNKAKQTYASWNEIRAYEAAYTRSAEDAICLAVPFDPIQFQKDLTHYMGVLIHNLEDLKEEENTDMRLQAFLNLKIARYIKAKIITEVFLDSVIKLNQANALLPGNPHIKQLSEDLQVNFANDIEHIQARDTMEMKRIASALNKDHTKYTDSFLLELPRIQTLDEIKKKFIGRWRLPEIEVIVEFKNDKTGTWEESGQTKNFEWNMTDRTVTIYLETEIDNFYMAEVTGSKMTAVWQEKKFVLIGCRKSQPAN